MRLRREGLQQHGIFRTYRILPPPLNPRMINSLTSSSTTGLYTRSHRKVMSGQLHWVRSNDIASSSYKRLTWQVLTGPGSVLNVPECEDKGREAKVETMNTENNEDKSEKEDGGSHDYDESMSFYDVGLMMTMDHVELDDDDEEEEDGWCLV